MAAHNRCLNRKSRHQNQETNGATHLPNIRLFNPAPIAIRTLVIRSRSTFGGLGRRQSRPKTLPGSPGATAVIQYCQPGRPSRFSMNLCTRPVKATMLSKCFNRFLLASLALSFATLFPAVSEATTVRLATSVGAIDITLYEIGRAHV